MSEITLNSDQLKEILKSAIIELLHENREEVSNFLAEVIEDVAMEQAIAWINQQLEALGVNIS